jgi:hypothetical protein
VLAGWLSLDGILIGRGGDLAPALAGALELPLTEPEPA